MPPQLLVSVRSPEEASIAAECGVPIIDFKEPNAGSLGMLDPKEIRAGVEAIRQVDKTLMCSAAMGEVTEWLTGDSEIESQLPQLNYLKLGLSGLADDIFWKEKWLAVRSKIESKLPSVNLKKFGWIAVAYVDAEVANSPEIPQIIEAARDSFCRGVLFDTFEKSDRRFSDWISDSQLLKHLETIHNAGMFCSVAGRLNEADLERLAKLPVDVLAVRSAACECGNRTAAISEEKIRQLQASINSSSYYKVENKEQRGFTTETQRHGGVNLE